MKDRDQKEEDIQNEKMLALGALAGSIAHDLNNILTAILGHLSFIKLSGEDAHVRGGESLVAVEEGVRRAAKLTQQILDFSRKDQIDGVVVEADICSVINSSIPLISPTLPENIILGLKIQYPSIVVLADETKISQIILNLVINAKDAMPQGGKILIEMDTFMQKESVTINGFNLEQRAYASIRVSDQGHGISDSIRSNIFDPFFTTKKGTGTGIGLATVFNLVKSMKGAINVESREGSGTCFEVIIPLSPNQKKLEPTQSSITKQNIASYKEEVRDNKKKILVVDDEDSVRNVLQRSLEVLGYEVVVAEDGVSALSKYKLSPDSFDLVIMDMIMPNMPGDELFYALKAVMPGVNVLISSGYSSDGKTQELLKNGAKGFIQKPFAIEELAFEIKKVLSS